MNGRCLLACSVVLNSLAFTAAFGQLVHFNPIPATGQNASVVLPSAASPTIDGVQLAVGDEIGVFSTQGLTVGAGSWSGENIAITVWGDDALTPEIDGVVAGDTLLIRVWDQSGDRELDDVLVTYSQGNGLYATDAILELSSLDAQSNLPIELASFDAVVVGASVRLSWTTLSEKENAGFEIQQRSDDGEFRGVTFVPGAGNSDLPVSYSYDIPGLTEGLYAFRFKQIDFSHGVSFSPIVEVSIRGRAPELLGNYPNPFNLNTTVSYTLPRASHVTLNLYDITGRAVRVLVSGSQPAGTHEVNVETTGLPAGVYFQQLRVGDHVESKRMQIVK